MVASWCGSRSLWSLLSSLVVLVPLMSWTLMVRAMVGLHGEGDVWGVRGVGGGVDGEDVVSGDLGRKVCGRTWWWWRGCCGRRVVWPLSAGGGGVVGVVVVRAVLASVVCRSMVVELFLVRG